MGHCSRCLFVVGWSSPLDCPANSFSRDQVTTHLPWSEGHRGFARAFDGGVMTALQQTDTGRLFLTKAPFVLS